MRDALAALREGQRPGPRMCLARLNALSGALGTRADEPQILVDESAAKAAADDYGLLSSARQPSPSGRPRKWLHMAKCEAHDENKKLYSLLKKTEKRLKRLEKRKSHSDSDSSDSD